MPEKKWIVVGVIIAVIVIGGVVAWWWLTRPRKLVLTIEYGQPWQYLVENLTLPKFKEELAKRGIDVEIKLMMIPYGVDFVAKITDDLHAGTAGDVLIIDSFMIPEYAEAGYLLDLTDYVKDWPDWAQFPEPMKKIVTWKGRVYGIMVDTDVRMIWYRKDIFVEAGILSSLNESWQPKSWADIFNACAKLAAAADRIKEKFNLTEFYPIYVPAGTVWGEATTMQGFYMLLLGAAPEVQEINGVRYNYCNRLYDYDLGKWIGRSLAIYRAFEFYYKIYVNNTWAPIEYNFAEDVWATHRKVFSEGKIAMELGGSWEWEEGWGPHGAYPIPNRDEVVGYAKMPGITGGKQGERPWVTISGGWAVAINAKIKPELKEIAWLFVKICASKECIAKYCAYYAKVAPRLDAVEVPEYAKNKYLCSIMEYLNFTDYRDALPGYSTVSRLIQEATEHIIKDKWDPMRAMNWFYEQLVREFGADKVLDLWPGE